MVFSYLQPRRLRQPVSNSLVYITRKGIAKVFNREGGHETAWFSGSGRHGFRCIALKIPLLPGKILVWWRLRRVLRVRDCHRGRRGGREAAVTTPQRRSLLPASWSFHLSCACVCSSQSCLTLCHSPGPWRPGFSVHGSFEARIRTLLICIISLFCGCSDCRILKKIWAPPNLDLISSCLQLAVTIYPNPSFYK